MLPKKKRRRRKKILRSLISRKRLKLRNSSPKVQCAKLRSTAEQRVNKTIEKSAFFSIARRAIEKTRQTAVSVCAVTNGVH